MAKISDFMSASPITIGPDASVGTALRMMDDHGIRHLPVILEGDLVGIVSDRDLRSCRPPIDGQWDRLDYAMDLLEERVTKHMTPTVQTVDAQASLGEAVDLVVRHRIGSLCVVEPGTKHLLGIVSLLDLLAALRPSARH